MTIRIGINGYGRIGRNVLRALYEGDKRKQIQIVAVNDLGDSKTNAHLTRRDTAHGPFPGTVTVDGDSMIVNGDRIRVLAQRDPSKLPWGELGVDLVLESTGFFASKEKASAHLKAGAKKVIISAPAGNEVDATIVFGVNHKILTRKHTIISNASCTTNCLAPLVKPLHEKIGVKHGLMTTIHAYTNDQVLTDVYHEDLRRARSATMSQIPTKTGAAAAVGLVLPELAGRLDGFAMRIPTINVSTVDLTFVAERKTSHEKLINVLLAPHITEKTSLAMQNHNSYSFRVRRESTKPDVKAAVELMFNVKVAKVNLVNETGKTRRLGKVQGRTQDIKKAYVRLAPGQTIDYEAKLKA